MTTFDYTKYIEEGVQREQTTVDTVVAKVRTEAGKKIADAVAEAQLMERQANAGIFPLKLDADSTPAPVAEVKTELVAETPPAAPPVLPAPTPAPVAESTPAPTTPAPAVVDEPEAPKPPAEPAMKQKMPQVRHWSPLQWISAALFAIFGLAIGLVLFAAFGGWVTIFTGLWYFLFVVVFVLAGFFLGGYIGWRLSDHPAEEVASS